MIMKSIKIRLVAQQSFSGSCDFFAGEGVCIGFPINTVDGSHFAEDVVSGQAVAFVVVTWNYQSMFESVSFSFDVSFVAFFEVSSDLVSFVNHVGEFGEGSKQFAVEVVWFYFVDVVPVVGVVSVSIAVSDLAQEVLRVVVVSAPSLSKIFSFHSS